MLLEDNEALLAMAPLDLSEVRLKIPFAGDKK
jgi:hypothetical protein